MAQGKVVDGGGSPIEGVSVSLSGVTCGTSQATNTDVNGDFVVASSGDRKLFFKREGYAPTWFNDKADESSADLVRFRSGETVSLPVVALQSLGAPGSIAGRVTAGGAPTAGVRVEVWTSPVGTAPLRTVVPETDGTYEAANLPPGSYLVRFFDSTSGTVFGENWYPAAVSGKSAGLVVVEAGLQIGGIDADLGAVGSVAGTLTENGQPLSLSSAKVCLADLLGSPSRSRERTHSATRSYSTPRTSPRGLHSIRRPAHSPGRRQQRRAACTT
jgi:hypothetical protein